LSARHLDGSFYTSPEVQALDKERIITSAALADELDDYI
jgi:hypothetical protein